MCGRYTLSVKDFSKHYGVEQGAFEFSSYNVAPSQSVPLVLEQGGERTVKTAQWGLLPSWILLAKSFIVHALSWAKRDVRVWALGTSSNQSANLWKLMADATAVFCKCVLASPL